jgi:hypothetical protein
MRSQRWFSLVDALIRLNPEPWREWQRFAQKLYAAHPDITAESTAPAIARDLLLRIDLVVFAANAEPAAWQMVELYRCMVDALFETRPPAKYRDPANRRDKDVLDEHWAGQPRKTPVDVFSFDLDPGFDNSNWRLRGGPLYRDEPWRSPDPLQPDPRIHLERNELRPWPGLVLPQVRVCLGQQGYAPDDPRLVATKQILGKGMLKRGHRPEFFEAVRAQLGETPEPGKTPDIGFTDETLRKVLRQALRP